MVQVVDSPGPRLPTGGCSCRSPSCTMKSCSFSRSFLGRLGSTQFSTSTPTPMSPTCCRSHSTGKVPAYRMAMCVHHQATAALGTASVAQMFSLHLQNRPFKVLQLRPVICLLSTTSHGCHCNSNFSVRKMHSTHARLRQQPGPAASANAILCCFAQLPVSCPSTTHLLHC